MHREHSPGYIIYQITKQVLTNLRLKSYQHIFQSQWFQIRNHNRRKPKNPQIYKKNTLLNNQLVKDEIKEEIKNILRQRKMETQHTKIYKMQQKQF